MSEQKKKRQRIYDLLNADTKPKFLYLPYTNQRKHFYRKSSFKKKGGGGSNKKRKEGFFTALDTVVKKDPTRSIRNHSDELKVHKKVVRRAIKQDLGPDLNSFGYAITDILKKQIKCNFSPKYWFT